jgi:hypothetical protein
LVLIFTPEHWPLLAVAETFVQVSAARARLSAASRFGTVWDYRLNVAAIPKTARTIFVLACQSICTPRRIGSQNWYNLIGEVVQSLYGLLFEQSSPRFLPQSTVSESGHLVSVRSTTDTT